MSHTTTTTDEDLAGQAALYALGTLDAAEARAFEQHVAAGCEACAAELRASEETVAQLAFGASPATPPAGVRARLLALASADADSAAPTGRDTATRTGGDTASRTERDSASRAGASNFIVLRAGEGEWIETQDAGVSYKLLFADDARGTFTTLVRMEPGARIQAHRHLGVEQCLVLEGDVRTGDIAMKAGDFNCSLPGSVHEELITDAGALLLIVSPERYEVVAPRPAPLS
jgi:anti-sigma factor ChrR (cupin superfamily)